jgi:hypothetical protein
MADIEEKPVETNSNTDNTEADPEKEWAPIRPQESRIARTTSAPGSRGTSTHSIQRIRSQNGYGCDDDERDSDDERGDEEKDPFEVGWHDGENDPMNPRSKNKAAKWAIVLICSFASFCV